MKILIAGDVVPSNDQFCEATFLDYWLSSDFRVVNLEAPIITQDLLLNKLPKYGPHLHCIEEDLTWFESLKPNLVNIGNNHILDYGPSGLSHTVSLLEERGIHTIGTGDDNRSANNEYVIVNGFKVCFYSCSDYEFSIASSSSPGANAYDFFRTNKDITKLKNENDYVIVLYHGGKEMYPYPSPELRLICHKMSEAGADIVLCQHSHCLGAYENFNESVILYGQGNFMFKGVQNPSWMYGVILELEVNEKSIKHRFVFYTQTGLTINLLEGNSVIEKEFQKRSMKVIDSSFLSENFKQYSNHILYNYIYSILGWSKLIIKIDCLVFKSFFVKKYINKNRYKLTNYLQCLAHRECILQGLLSHEVQI